jgi:hypothetical protein
MEAPHTISQFEFTQIQKTKHCAGCKINSHPHHGPSNSYYLFLSGGRERVQERLDNSLTLHHECIDCSCLEVYI